MPQNLIIGAGPAGLAVAGRMRQQSIPFQIIEQSNQVGSAWRKHYERLHLHTVKQWSHLPHLPFPEDYPLYVPRLKFVEYLENYASHFDIKPIFGQAVKRIRKLPNGHWVVDAKKTFEAQNVIVGTGINRVPNTPSWQGQSNFKGDILHSRFYKNAQPFLGKKILVIGMGNTGAEIALDLSEHHIETYLSVRSPVSVLPRDLNGRPVQVTAKQLAKIPFGIGDWIGSVVRKFYIGNLEKYGLQTESLHPAELLRTTGKTPVIDIGTVAAIKAGKIKVLPDIEQFSANSVLFKNKEELAFDAVILATGYRAKVEDFIEKGEVLLNQDGIPQSSIGRAYHKGLFFVGFDQYKLGGILGTIDSDSESVVNAIK